MVIASFCTPTFWFYHLNGGDVYQASLFLEGLNFITLMDRDRLANQEDP